MRRNAARIMPQEQARTSLSRRALLICGAVGLASGALPVRVLAQTSFVLPSEGDKVGAHTVSNSPETSETRVNTEIVIVD
jgi:hypothetical protein